MIQSILKHKNHFWFLVAILVGFALRAYRLNAQSLWNDEGTSVALASLSLPAIVDGAAKDIHPPLYYFLLHFWISLAGQTEFAVRLLSVFAGVLVVAATFRIAHVFFDAQVGTIAAFVAAFSPFQVYFSQEARMYIWVTLWSAASVFAMAKMLGRSARRTARTRRTLAWLLYIAASIATLYTQYVGAFVLIAENLAFAVWLWLAGRDHPGAKQSPRNLEIASSHPSTPLRALLAMTGGVWHSLAFWIAAQVIIVLAFAPWYFFAGGQLTSWPAVSEAFDLPTLLWRVLNVFSVGLTLEGAWTTLVAVGFGILFLIGWWWTRDAGKNWGVLALMLWTLVPVGALYVVSLARPAYDPKFLLLATPAFFVLVARGLDLLRVVFGRRRWIYRCVGSFVILVPSLLSLTNYYFDPRYARDDYRTMVQFIDANARAGDGILVDAPGQIDVVRYYHRGDQPLFLLPLLRPPDPASTRAQVDEMLTRVQRLFAIYYATEQSDPLGLVESRLAARAFKARDEWHGEVRLAIYGIAPASRSAQEDVGATFGDEITLQSLQLEAREGRSGDVLTLTLNWHAGRVPSARYKVFVHLLGGDDRVVAQRDGEPMGDTRVTLTWRAGESIADNYGIWIESGIPPGDYRVEIGMYRADNGTRLPIVARDGRVIGDHFVLGTVRVR